MINSRFRGFHWTLLLGTLALVATGCRPAPSQRPLPASPTQATDTAHPTSTTTPTLTATPTLSPTPTSTPGPQFDDTQTFEGVEYTLPLTLQSVSENSATVYFELNQAIEGTLFYWRQDQEQTSGEWVRFDSEAPRHELTISGLDMGTDYFLAVGIETSGGTYSPPSFQGAAWDPIRFHTLDLAREPLHIGVVGDSGFGQPITRQLTELMATADLDFVIHLGDVVYKVEDNQDAYEAFALKYYDSFSPLLRQIPVYPVLGNHEYDQAADWQGLPFYAQAFPPLVGADILYGGQDGFRQFYALTLGGIQFLFLDSQAFWTGNGYAEQNAWLKERLLDSKVQATIAVLHVPPYSSGFHPNDGSAIRQQWVPLFEESNVVLVLSGHDHNYQHIVVNGLDYVVSGGGSGVLYTPGEMLPESKRFIIYTHFVLLNLFHDHIDLVAISVDGQLIDTFRINFPS